MFHKNKRLFRCGNSGKMITAGLKQKVNHNNKWRGLLWVLEVKLEFCKTELWLQVRNRLAGPLLHLTLSGPGCFREKSTVQSAISPTSTVHQGPCPLFSLAFGATSPANPRLRSALGTQVPLLGCTSKEGAGCSVNSLGGGEEWQRGMLAVFDVWSTIYTT